jgi:proline dehydrogenase
MLYGIQRPLQQRLVHAGRPLRVLVAYGEYWFAWYMRRLAERPANVWFVVKNVFRLRCWAAAPQGAFRLTLQGAASLTRQGAGP